jgi:Mg2+-importing ATPase
MTKSKTVQHTDIEAASSHLLQSLAYSESKNGYALLNSNPSGLTHAEAAERLEVYGTNEVRHDKIPEWYIQLVHAFINPFNGILVVIGIISLIIDVVIVPAGDVDYTTVILVGAMVILSTILRFWQEYRSNLAAEALKKMITTTVTVIRDAVRTDIDLSAVVPGDIILLSAGDMIPADCRILQSKDLFVNESMLTGESLPVEKIDRPVKADEHILPLDLPNLCFFGTNVVSGTATVIAVTTGERTFFGRIGKSIISNERPQTSFDKGIASVSWLLIRFMLIMVPLVFLINGLTKGDWVEALLFGISVAVGLTPEMLPMVVTTNLAKGAIALSRQKVIVKRLNAIQNLGAMDILCTDKTGTLTMNKVILETHINVDGDEDDEVLKWAYLNSYYQTGLKNLLDSAILEHVEVNKYINVDEHYTKIDELPFDFNRRRMSVILEEKNGRHLLICKGAVEEVLSLCTHAFDPGTDRQLHVETDTIVPMDEEMRQRITALSKKLNEDGLRILLVAIREFEKRPAGYTLADESDLVLTGFIGFLDPAKPSAKPALDSLMQLGVSVKVLTGDNDIVARKICRDVGLPINKMLLGSDLNSLSDEELQSQIDSITVFAKLDPTQKIRIVSVLQHKGHTVGFLGDGINDAAALRKADVGISVDSAVDVAKESADIILLERDLEVIKTGVISGRNTFGNIIKYIKMAASSNFGNVFSVIGASILLPFLPMLPIQLLIQNLLYDFSQTSIPWDRMDEEFIRKPQKWSADGIRRFMLFIGPTSSVFDYVTFFVMFYVFKASMPEQQSLFQSGWFIEGLLSQTLIVHMIRTRKIPFIESRATLPVLLLTGLIMAIGIYIPFSPLASAFRMQPLPSEYFLWLVGILLSYCVLVQIIKNWYIRKFQQWL